MTSRYRLLQRDSARLCVFVVVDLWGRSNELGVGVDFGIVDLDIISVQGDRVGIFNNLKTVGSLASG